MFKVVKVIIVLFTVFFAQIVTADTASEFKTEYEKGLHSWMSNNYAEAVRIWRPLAERGYVQAQWEMGNIYYVRGKLPFNYAEALHWFTKAAAQGDSGAEAGLNHMKKNQVAIQFLHKLADQGDIEAKQFMVEVARYEDASTKEKFAQQANAEAKGKEDAARQAKEMADAKIASDREVKMESARRAKAQKQIATFRNSIKEGDETNCGPVLAVKAKLIQISFPVANYGNEHWVRRDEILPSGYGCSFVNGQYQIQDF